MKLTLKLNIQKIKIMASGPIISWHHFLRASHKTFLSPISIYKKESLHIKGNSKIQSKQKDKKVYTDNKIVVYNNRELRVTFHQ